MATLYPTEAGRVQWDPVDGIFNLPILVQLRAYLEGYAWIFPDERLYRRFVMIPPQLAVSALLL
jgi:hypothetical protein